MTPLAARLTAQPIAGAPTQRDDGLVDLAQRDAAALERDGADVRRFLGG